MTRDTRVGENDPNYRYMTCLRCGTGGYALKYSVTSRTNLCPSCQPKKKEAEE